MDPRIRERRSAVRRREGQRRLRVVVSAAVCAAVTGLILTVLHSPLLSVRHVSISGAHHTSRQAVMRATGLDDHPLMISLDAGRLERRLDGLPWVARATVSRTWPSTVRISLTERVEVAAVTTADGAWATVDAGGRVLVRSAGTPPRLPALLGVGQPPAPGSLLPAQTRPALDVLAALRPPVVGSVSSVSLLPDGEVDLAVVPGVVVRLGDATQLRQKLATMNAVLSQVKPPAVRTLDVRVPDAPAVTRS